MSFNNTANHVTKRIVQIGVTTAVLVVSPFMLAACQTAGKSAALETPEPIMAEAPKPKPSNLNHEDAGKVFEGYLGARLAEYRGDLDMAGKLYLRAMRADTENGAVRDRAFALLLASGDYQGAVEVAKASLAQDKEKALPLVLMLATFDYAITGKYDEALQSLEAMRGNSPDLVQFELIEDYIKLAQGMPVDDVISSLEAFKPGAGLVVYKYYHLGRLYERKGDMDKAIQMYRSGQMLDPSALFIVSRLGLVLEAEGQAEAAKAVYNSFLALHPNSLLIDTALQRVKKGETITLDAQKIDDDLAEVMFGLASIMMGQNIPLTARQFLHLALMAKPDHALSVFTIGLVEEQSNNYERALSYYKRIKPDMLPYLAAQSRIGETYYRMGETEKSIKYFENLVAQRPDVPTLKQALAQNYFDEKQYQKAADVYGTLIDSVEGPLDRQHSGLFFARGAAYERMKQYDKATVDLSKALELDPQNAVILNYLGYMWINQGKNIEQGYDYIKQAVVLRPNDGAIVDSLGWVYYKRGKFDVAVRYLEKAVSLMPDDATINMHLGDVYHKLGRTNEARVQWRRALEIGPENPADLERLQHLMTSN